MKNLFAFSVWILLGGLLVAIPQDARLHSTQPIPASYSPSMMNYHDVAEAVSLLQALDASSEYVSLWIIGESIDFRTHPASPDSYPIYALRISADSPHKASDRGDRNAILFDCAVHAREWLTAESCLELAVYLTYNRSNNTTPVPELLDHAEVWIIPMADPAGRILDDRFGGDPTQFFNTAPWFVGWRNNGDTRLCNMGVNVARNFTRGFNDAEARVFCSSPYRGFAPFSTTEANALRQFINNHMISMVVTSHSEGQLIWNQWDSGDVAGQRIIYTASKIWRSAWASMADQDKYALDLSGVGGGNGQFSSWLSDTSTRSGNEIDQSVNPWAFPGDLPLAGDFDRDGQVDDVAIYRTPPVGDQYHWYYDYDHDGDTDEEHGPWARQSGDRPFAGDFDSDGYYDDVAVFRSADSSYHYDFNHDADTDQSFSCGTTCQHPVALDYDGDGFVDDRASFCSADRKWYFDIDHNCSTDGIGGAWGLVGDLPFSGDFDRDGEVDDLGVFRPSNRMWYYDLDHDGDTDHASGPWGASDGSPVAGNFNYDPFASDPDELLDDVGLFIPAARLWQYDEYHNATFPQLDDGTRRGIQTIMLELPVKDDIYPTSMYIQAPGDGSNGFHPSGNAVAGMIDDAFIPMALHLIRQARAPGCPTNSNGSADSDYCPAQDAGLVGAKIIPASGSEHEPGVLRSLPAERTSWSEVTPGLEQLDWGSYRMIYRVQNFATSSASYVARMIVKRWECPFSGACAETILLDSSRSHTLGSRSAISDEFSLSLIQLAYQEGSYAENAGDHYEVILKVSPSGGGSDDFTSNDTKVFKFQVVGLQLRLFLPLLIR